MSIKRKGVQTESAVDVEYDNLTIGEHEGRLAYVADLGLQQSDYKGEIKVAQQLSLGIEILESTVKIDGEEHPRVLWTKPFNVFNNLTEKGNELIMLKNFDSSATEGSEADWEAQIYKPVSVNVVHTKGKGDAADMVYDNIGSLVAIPQKYQGGVAAAAITDGCTGDCDDANSPAIKALYGLAKYVFTKRLTEAGAKAVLDRAKGVDAPVTKTPVMDTPPVEAYDDDIPF